MLTEDQDDILDFLARPETHGLRPGDEVRRIDTHISAVFVAGDDVYKLKRAVRYSYLDFSTAERRRAACEAEVRLNRRTARPLYHGVVPLVRTVRGDLALAGPEAGGDGEPVDWLVHMHRFDDDTLFDRLAADGRLNDALVRRLADTVAGFHESAEERRDHGGAAGLRWVIENNAECLGDAPAGLFLAETVAAVNYRSREALERVGAALDRRREEGLVRRCHGDLHLRNICLWEGQPTLFDCIEFSESIACIDVLYDLAFLLMDLEHRDLRRFANLVMNRYLLRRRDLDGLVALPLFMATRAAIKAHVTASAAETAGPAQQEKLHEEGRRYLDLAAAILEPQPARLVAVGGLSGSGKSTLALALAPLLGGAPGALVARSDELRKGIMGVGPETRLGPEGYRPEVGERVYEALGRSAFAGLRAGRCVVADAVFARPDERIAIESAAREAGATFTGIWLDAPETALVERVEGRTGDVSDADAGVVRRQLGYETGRIDWHRIDAGAGPERVLEAVRTLLG
ncbi:MAG: AAA family ATPase [Acetobacterales bacterium]